MRRISLVLQLLVLAALSALFGAIITSAPSAASGPVCHTAGRVMNELSQLNVRSDQIVTTDDADLIAGYLGALGVALPEGIVVTRIIFASFGDTTLANLVSPDDCVPLVLAVPTALHDRALKSATAGI